MKIVGHKGAAGDEIENTLPSFKAAIAIGCDRTELDVRLTKDGQAIVCHDKEVSKLTNGTGLISEMTLSEIQQLDCHWGNKIPTLQEVIDVCKHKIDMQIELKAEGTPAVVNDLILENNIEKEVVISSFKPHLLQEIKKINPALKVGLLFWKEETLLDIRNLVESIPLDFLAPFSEIISKAFVEKAHTLGKTVYAYMVNTKMLGDRLEAMGVDEIGTDFPKLFITHMDIWTLEKLLRKSRNKDTCYAKESILRSHDNPAFWQCGVTSLIVQDYFGWEILYCSHNDHYRNRLANGNEIDLTRSQFAEGTVICIDKIVPRISLLGRHKDTERRYQKLKQSVEYYMK
jgi:glycerophosphoryl diester phosphodiesterase